MRSIRTKITLLVISTVFISVLFAGAFFAWVDARTRFESRVGAMKGIAAALATSISQSVAQGDMPAAGRTLGAIGRIPDITFARIMGNDDRVLWQHGFGIVVERSSGDVALNRQIGPFSHLYLGSYPITASIVYGGRDIGELLLIADFADLRLALRDSILSAIAAAALAILAGLALAWRLQRGITGPITKLTATMVEVSRSRDYRTKVAIESNDETALMVRAFRLMLDEINTRDRQLIQHRDHLESEVAERTAELVTAKQAAERANAAKSEFLSTMSHEIRTPLNGMLVTSELIATHAADPKARRQGDILVSSGRTLLAIINDILDLSKIEAGRMTLETVPLDPRRLVADIVALFRSKADETGLALAGHVGADVPELILGDPVRLGQIVTNLVSNALKFTKSGSVTITFAREPGEAGSGEILCLTVEDTGMGIPADRCEAIFEAFAQADGSTTRKFGGTGIGLTICRRLAAAMGGSIAVRSRVGTGSAFAVRIPLRAAPAAVSTSASVGGDDTRSEEADLLRRPLRVLAADDNAINREVIAEALTRLGCTPVCVANGQEAVAEARTGGFDVILMDCRMPVMDGYEAARIIRRWEQDSHIAPHPIVALTAHVLGEEEDKWRDAGMSGHLAKPYTLAGLRQALADATLGRAPASPETAAVPVETGNAPESLVDDGHLSSLRDFQQDGDDLVGRLVRLYGDQSGPQLDNVRGAADAGDLAQLAASAHALRSMSANIGARRVAALCAAIETSPADALREKTHDALAHTLADTLVALHALTSARPAAGAQIADAA